MTNRNKKLAGVSMVGFAIFIIWGFAVPAYEQIGQLQAGVSEMESILESRSNIFGAIEKLKATYNSNSDEIEKVSIIISPQKRIPELISAVDNLATINGLALSSLNITDGETETQATLNIEADLEGTYESFKSFLTGLERNRRLIEMGVIKLNLTQSGNLQIEVTGYAHILNMPKTNQAK
ncbi:MAG: hypothetical protein A3J46_04365 [Candidatus Yanofskybacteria bacterium RIFCSPHIGHO2_02_FULL_41_11]|uniref:Pilus assembly protein PilO n=1 Tax=Candidatus Yanofskybacteria bacterium RIFCSPHIGHO2_02_FULL_41_11 TaxID=1802675 RepID=A0A1F8F6J5_9BACT|nr:MAG: hypothetical protein A3J46_04365 [Candidatus Yanofskybacteria bacterium RIFCSPHIGHO2_02_FULL_41_11]